jgi:hypothetical protein
MVRTILLLRVYCEVRKRDMVKQELAFAERAGRSGICHQPGETETRRKDIWVDEEFGGSAKNKIAWATAGGLTVPVIRRRSEFGPLGEIALRVKNGKRQRMADPSGKGKQSDRVLEIAMRESRKAKHHGRFQRT